MYWQEDNDDETEFEVPDNIVDLSFKIQCKALPLDHSHALSQQLFSLLPWLEDEPAAGIHTIHVAESGNGWIRPEDPSDLIFPSRRTRMTLRLPAERIEDAASLTGKSLDILGNTLTLGSTSLRKLSNLTTLFSRHLALDEAEDEAVFMRLAQSMLKEKGIHVKKMMCGRLHTHQLPDRQLISRSLMLDGMDMAQSVQLQQEGLGPGRKLGCGLFLPHKGIDAVKTAQQK